MNLLCKPDGYPTYLLLYLTFSLICVYPQHLVSQDFLALYRNKTNIFLYKFPKTPNNKLSLSNVLNAFSF